MIQARPDIAGMMAGRAVDSFRSSPSASRWPASPGGRTAWLPAIWVGVFLAIGHSLFVGAGLQLVSAEFPQKAQELFEAVVGTIAVLVLLIMVFWMRTAARSIKSELHASVDAALSGSSGQARALIGLVFFAVAREGLESIFFLLAIFRQSEGLAAPLGALAGLLAATATVSRSTLAASTSTCAGSSAGPESSS